MGHEIDLEKYNIRTDLVLDTIENSKEDIKKDIYENNGCSVTKIVLDNNSGFRLNKKEGTYVTIEFNDVTDSDNRDKVRDVFVKELKYFIDNLKLKCNYSVLVIGLGNEKSTPDSLGPKTICNVLVTRYLFLIDKEVQNGIRCTSSLRPGVMADTGIETFDIISSITEKIHPDLVLVIDALAASSINRINRTIQITDSGIHPGSGIGNMRKEISKDTLGVPVIAIGVPTVVSSSIIVYDTLNYLFKHISYIKDNQNKNKLIYSRNNYLNKIKNQNLSKNDREALAGLLGSLSGEEEYDLISEVLNALSYNFIVTPKEVDFVIEKLADIISSGINSCLHEIDVKKV